MWGTHARLDGHWVSIVTEPTPTRRCRSNAAAEYGPFYLPVDTGSYALPQLRCWGVWALLFAGTSCWLRSDFDTSVGVGGDVEHLPAEVDAGDC